jgi:hypothetical protein
METKFTKGDWSWLGERTDGTFCVYKENNKALDFIYNRIADVFGKGKKGREANARLIAAAPDLYFHSIAMVVFIRKNLELFSGKDQEIAEQILTDCEETLKKVTG